jgi:hypothetical protein
MVPFDRNRNRNKGNPEMRRYCIEQLDTGLYWLAGEWCEEPEWFDSTEAFAIARSISDPSPIAVRSTEFDPNED